VTPSERCAICKEDLPGSGDEGELGGMDGPCVNAITLVKKCSPRPGSGAVAVDRDDGVAWSLAMT